ncbi:hypothetical protein GQ44DRAFT_744425 [Phaeosphaeriaceae sp. PMI808]|nr:hypothetical protein GQ44DRAFT_744425 [Phaeosphaeriaceae sp. PMI808]
MPGNTAASNRLRIYSPLSLSFALSQFQPLCRDPDQLAGPRQMEAVTRVWTKKWLFAAYILIWIISFVKMLIESSNELGVAYTARENRDDELLNFVHYVSSIAAGVAALPLAKFIDIYGRPRGFLCVACIELPLITMAVSHNSKTHIAAQTFLTIGTYGMDYLLDIFIVDTSLLKNRLIWLAIKRSPYALVGFVGEQLSGYFAKNSSWNLAYGVFSILFPMVCLPFHVIFHQLSGKAHKMGILTASRGGRTFRQSIIDSWVEFNIIGVVLVCSGCSLVRVSFSIRTDMAEHWASPISIGMAIAGFLLIIVFFLRERFWAPRRFFSYHILKDRSVVGACLLTFNVCIAFFSVRTHYSLYLRVVFGMSEVQIAKVYNIHYAVINIWQIIVAFSFKYSDRYKWAGILAIPIYFIMYVLLIEFRYSSTYIGILVLVDVCVAICTATLTMIEYASIMTAVPHGALASSLALWIPIFLMGSSLGTALSNILFQLALPKKLREFLPDSGSARMIAILQDPNFLQYLDKNSVEKQAIVKAYTELRKYTLFIGVAGLVPCFLWISLLRNKRLSKYPARKGLNA